ncbi:MAG: hypothetical protein PF636_04045 [Actinomycetota bacterium]|nr:hypothetical protein [Actinomycetota bacterium]
MSIEVLIGAAVFVIGLLILVFREPLVRMCLEVHRQMVAGGYPKKWTFLSDSEEDNLATVRVIVIMMGVTSMFTGVLTAIIWM